MKYNHYLLNDFVTDDYFLEWVKNPDHENNLFWKKWIAQNPHKKELIKEARQIILLFCENINKSSAEDFSEVKHNIFKLIHQDEELVKNNTISKNLEHHDLSAKSEVKFLDFKRYYLRSAAIFLGLLILSSILIYIIQTNQTTKYVTAFGETKSIELPDGSTVVLNSNSSLKVSNDWANKNIREVWLKGEAFFQVLKKELPEVAHTAVTGKKVKFIVNVDKLKVEVIGTKFNVNSRRGLVKVVLNSGQVNLQSSNNHLVMNPGEMVEYSPSNETFYKKSVEAEKITSWRHQKFIFEETPLLEIGQVIEDNYGLHVEFNDQSLPYRNFTGSVPYQDVDLFLTVLAESFNLKIIKKQDTIMMKTKY